MPDTNDERIEALVQEVHELKSDIKELCMLVVYALLKTEEQRARSRFNDTLLSFAKHALKAAVDQLAELEGKMSSSARDAQQSTKVPVKSRKAARKPTVDVDKEIAILKDEMAASLRNAANEIEDERAKDEREDAE
jgi:hypothetical protein